MIYKLLIIAFVFQLFLPIDKTFREFNGGRWGYSYTSIKLYDDNTYYFSEWQHTSYSIQDSGKYFLVNDTFFLNSIIKTRQKAKNNKDKSRYRFDKQPFILKDSILQILPKSKIDASFYDAYYTFYEKK